VAGHRSVSSGTATRYDKRAASYAGSPPSPYPPLRRGFSYLPLQLDVRFTWRTLPVRSDCNSYTSPYLITMFFTDVLAMRLLRRLSPPRFHPFFAALELPAFGFIFLNFFARFSISASCFLFLCFFRLDASILE
jgi:hypothetical protein